MIVVITGASGAIGKEAARLFAQKGASLCLLGYAHYDDLQQEAQRLQECYGVRVVTAKADFAMPDEVRRVLEYALAVFGHVDCLVNNAALSSIKPVSDLSLDEWQRVLAVNLTAAFVAAQAVLPSMYHRGGSIVNVSSMWGTLGASCETAYAASKGALNALGKSLAREYEGTVRVNTLSLGFVDTPMNAHLSNAEKEAFFAENPSMRLLSPREAAQAIVRLADSKKSGQIVRLGWK